MQNLSPEGLGVLEDVAKRHGVSRNATIALFRGLVEGHGSQAQFNHPDLGGMGQWSQGGMIMVGDMFNQGLKHRIDMLCNELAQLLRSQSLSVTEAGQSQSQYQSGGEVSLFVRGTNPSGQWWPGELGSPASTGAQNNLRYAFFPASRRLAIQHGSMVRVYDSGEHVISGFSQQQSGDQSLTFTSQFGLVRVADLPLVPPEPGQRQEPPVPFPATRPAEPEPALFTAVAAAPVARQAREGCVATDDILATIERLADLRQKGILTDEEFGAKKAELLNRI
jgi:hypothetical protein